ncbi:hypothetical protein GobsT_71390 [Gemmata obscuriglobus]|uniref:Uncharacterized protein n=1 Tax=Gemmata obscuriglobus TaxID=114 RepID=A0A2Z3H7L6_9BACT|nr:hypothetical protein [Gemmata obscuriglobus]AWM41758.1 hypothetical protein C1280_35360 [Gemmata obscuriglobus]QEG32286.1 hypothetical protein GobsT_71390 [Gemmata obscuriglobus]VTS11642.1 unnamed protein product [Gemmata obscuriglobus UQM 2246]
MAESQTSELQAAAAALAAGGSQTESKAPTPPKATGKTPGRAGRQGAGKAKESEEGAEETAPASGLARLCEPSDRAGGGLKRFKLRLEGHPSGVRTQRYVLAPDRAEAEAEYLRAEKVDPEDIDSKAVRLVVTELPD